MVSLSPAYRSAPVAETRIRKISMADLRWALAQGWEDFKDKRGDVLFVGLIYTVVGLVASGLAARRELLPLIFPLVAGLSILGPAVASGFYELARRREAGQDATWSHFLDPFVGPARGSIIALGLVLAAMFSLWLGVAWAIYEVTLGRLAPATGLDFIRAVFTTPEGWAMIVGGNLAGLLFAIAVLAISLVSFPMVVDRQGRPLDAVLKSIEACSRNRGAVAVWGLWVAALLVLGSIPLFAGLAVVTPLLGYATWHLYTRLIER